ncbi:MAG: hypothetical protein GWM90_21920 [Gemmatimonadetes bacterium]|nr:chorismate mutase [Gemmatimonadota bacterium]NIQ57227.1 chorismate mutase [Gemmatimonadota bacterium]NIX46640.1 hypothetical protein [Gemmatimonadota bacterium]
MTELRERIGAVDREILDAVARRLELARRIGARKRDAASATLDPEREAAVIRRAVETGRELGLPAEAVRELFWTLVGLCRSAQLDSG